MTMDEQLCVWIFCSSAIGVQGGYWWDTRCGHRANGVKQLPSHCDYCHRPVIDANTRAQVSAGEEHG